MKQKTPGRNRESHFACQKHYIADGRYYTDIVSNQIKWHILYYIVYCYSAVNVSSRCRHEQVNSLDPFMVTLITRLQQVIPCNLIDRSHQRNIPNAFCTYRPHHRSQLRFQRLLRNLFDFFL